MSKNKTRAEFRAELDKMIDEKRRKENAIINNWKAKSGEWQNESDLEDWVDKKTNYECEAARSLQSGFWCGYVLLPENSLFFEDCNNEEERLIKLNKAFYDLEVHGGITFFAKTLARGYAIGFDCAHENDVIPTIDVVPTDIPGLPYLIPPYKTYKNLEFVKKECTNLAKQLKELELKAKGETENE